MNKLNLKSIFAELKQRPLDWQALERSRARLAAYIEDHPARSVVSQEAAPFVFGMAAPRFRYAASFAGLLILAVIGSVTVYASAKEALPGDRLYPVKLLAEDISLRAAFDPSKKAKLRGEFFEKRTRELEDTVSRLGSGREGRGGESRRLEGLSGTLKNLSEQAGELEKDSGRRGRSGRDSDYYRASERLRADAVALENVLEDSNLKRGKLKEEAATAHKRIGELKLKIDQDLSEPRDAKAEAAQAALKAAAASIKSAEDRLSRAAVGQEQRERFGKEIEKAKSLLKEAESSYASDDLDKAYKKALESVRQSTLTERKLEASPEVLKRMDEELRPELKREDGKGKNGGSQSDGRSSGSDGEGEKLNEIDRSGSNKGKDVRIE